WLRSMLVAWLSPGVSTLSVWAPINSLNCGRSSHSRMAAAKRHTPDTAGCSVDAEGASPSGMIRQLLVRHSTSGTSNRYSRFAGLFGSASPPAPLSPPVPLSTPLVVSPPEPGNNPGTPLIWAFQVLISGTLLRRKVPFVFVVPPISAPEGDVNLRSTSGTGCSSSSTTVIPRDGTGGCCTRGR